MHHCSLSNKRGAIAIIAGFSLLLVLGFAAFVIDIGYGLVVRNALQNVADATSLAATRELGSIYRSLPPEVELNSYQLTTLDRTAIVAKAIDAGQHNSAAGKAVLINESDIAIGRWDFITKTLTVGDDRPDAVRVIARRDNTVDDSLHTFFAGLIGRDRLAVNAHATAALSGLGHFEPGELEVPLGISEKRCDPDHHLYEAPILELSPTGDSCAAWTTFDQPHDMQTLRDEILQEMVDGEYVSPSVDSGNTWLNFNGGEGGKHPWDLLLTLFNLKKDPTTGVWETGIVIYGEEEPDCKNQGGIGKVVGFAMITIKSVQTNPDFDIEADIACDKIEEGRGSGSNIGVIGSIPNLVQ